MLRALLARFGLTNGSSQLELALPVAGHRNAPVAPRPDIPRPPRANGVPTPLANGVPTPGVSHTRRVAGAPSPDDFLERLRPFGLEGITAIRLTQNRSTLVSYRGTTLRVHAGFVDAPEEVLRALAVFVSARGATRAAARRVIVGYPITRDVGPRPLRATATHADDRAIAERLQREHAQLNVRLFGGALRDIPVKVSRRMKTRLGHYASARAHVGAAEIVVSRRHLRRHGWAEAVGTLLHEMVHQWQEESGTPIDHGPIFRRKAREVGVTPRARRLLI